MAFSHIRGTAWSAISAVRGIAKASIAALRGIAPSGGGGGFGDVITTVSGKNAGSSGSTFSCTTASGPASGDKIVFILEVDPSAQNNFGSFTGPSGFTASAYFDVTTTDGWARLIAWEKTSNGTEGTSYSATCSIGMSDWCTTVLIFHASSGTLSLGTAVSAQDTGSDTTWNFPALTTTQADSRAVAVVGGGGNGDHGGTQTTSFSSWGGGYTEVSDVAIAFSSIGVASQYVATAQTIAASSVTASVSDVSLGAAFEVKVS